MRRRRLPPVRQVVVFIIKARVIFSCQCNYVYIFENVSFQVCSDCSSLKLDNNMHRKKYLIVDGRNNLLYKYICNTNNTFVILEKR